MRRASILFGVFAVIAVVAAAVALAACGSSSSGGGTSSSTAPAATTGPIKVGHIVNLTGPEAAVGSIQEKCLNEAFKTIGTIDGRPVEVFTEDAQGTSAAAVDAARKLVESDGVVALIGPTEIGQKTAVANYLNTSGHVPDILYNPSPPNLLTSSNKWIVASGGSTNQQPSVMGDYLYKTMGYRTMDTLTEDSSAGRSFADPLTAIFTKEGGKVLKQQWTPDGASDFSSYLTTMPQADILAAWEAGGAAQTLVTQWVQLGINKKMPMAAIFHGGMTDAFVPMGLPKQYGQAMVGMLAAQAYDPNLKSPENKQFVAAITPVLGYPPSDDGASGPWQAAMLFAAGVQGANGNTSPDQLMTGILGAHIVGPEGAESFPAGSNAATKIVYVEKVAFVPAAGFAPAHYTYTTIKSYGAIPPAGYTPK